MVKEGSLDTQQQRLQAAIVAKGDPEHWLVSEIYREEGKSGKNTERPELQRLLHDIWSGKINCVLTTKLDRLTRSLLDFYELHKLFETLQVQFISLDESFDTSSATGRAMLKITLVFAELERERTSERTKEARKARAERGLRTGGQVLGYDLNKDDRGVPIVNEDEANLVRLIFETYLDCGSLLETAARINEAGFRTKSYLSKRNLQQGGKLFQNTHVNRIIRNRLYVGMVEHKNKWFKGRHQPIVDHEIFRKANDLLTNNNVRHVNLKKPVNHVFTLQGILRCGECSSPMVPDAGTGKSGRVFYYYKCGRLNHFKTNRCSVCRIPAKPVEAAIQKSVIEYANRPEMIEGIIDEANRQVQQGIPPLRSQRSALENSLAKVISQGERWAGQVLDGEIAGNDFIKQKLQKLLKQKAQLESEISKTDDSIRRIENQVLDAQVVVTALKTFQCVLDSLPQDEQKLAYQKLIRQVTYRPNMLEIDFLEGRSVVIELGDKETGGNHGGDDGKGRKKAPQKRTPSQPLCRGSLGVLSGSSGGI